MTVAASYEQTRHYPVGVRSGSSHLRRLAILLGLVAALHLYFLVLEMFLWTKPYGRRVFGLTPEKAEMTKSLAANQGLYNGFLAAGLAWGLALGWLVVCVAASLGTVLAASVVRAADGDVYQLRFKWKTLVPRFDAKLSDALSVALHTDAAVRAFNAMGFKPGPGTPNAMTRQIESDMRLFTTVIRERNLKFDS